MSKDDPPPPNPENRHLVFKQFDSNNHNRVNFREFVTFFKWAWFFSNNNPDSKGFV